MKILIDVPDDTKVVQMGKYTIWSSGENGIMVIDDSLLDPVIVTPSPTPEPTPTPTPVPATEYFRVIVDKLNVRYNHSTNSQIMTSLKRGDSVRLVGNVWEDDSYKWRQTEAGYWVAIYAKASNTSYLEIDTSQPGG